MDKRWDVVQVNFKVDQKVTADTAGLVNITRTHRTTFFLVWGIIARAMIDCKCEI
jgi:hypothetical protein